MMNKNGADLSPWTRRDLVDGSIRGAQAPTTSLSVKGLSSNQIRPLNATNFTFDSAPAGAPESPLLPILRLGQKARPVRVLLVDSDASPHHAISKEILNDPRCELVAQSTTVKEARQLIDRHPIEVMLVDLSLSDGTGFELIEHLKKARPLAEAIVITSVEDERHAIRSFQLGATGYLVKDTWTSFFSQAILQVVNGGLSITPALARRLISQPDYKRVTSRRPAARSDGYENLSRREREVLQLVETGCTSNEIGRRLAISPLTVNSHFNNVYRKLKVRSRAQAITVAIQNGLIESSGCRGLNGH